MGWGLSNVLVEVARIFLGNNTHPFAQASFWKDLHDHKEDVAIVC